MSEAKVWYPSGEPDSIDWAPAKQAARDAVERDGLKAEACGIVVSGRVLLHTNVARETGRFAFSDEDSVATYDALEAGTLDGIWHSHPLGHMDPSPHDWDGHPHGIAMYIVMLVGKSEYVTRWDDHDRRHRREGY